MKAIAISGTNLWSNDHSNNWHHYSSATKRSQDKFRPLNLPSNDLNNNLNRNQNHFIAQKSSKVCRCLFGPSDPIESQRLAYEMSNNRRYVDRNRWNFDFHKETPLTGRFEWRMLGGGKHSDSNQIKKRSGDYNTSNHNNNSLKPKNIWPTTINNSNSNNAAKNTLNHNVKQQHYGDAAKTATTKYHHQLHNKFLGLDK